MKTGKSISIDEMKKIELNILNQFAFFCDENNLQYSLCGGTLLGAVRHKGFIPWDDDIDVFVPRQSYEYICKKFNKWGKKKHLKLVNYFSPHYYSTFAKIIDTRTVAIEEKRNEKIGVWIDLFIVESMKRKEECFSNPIIKSLKGIRYFGSEDYYNKKQSFIKNLKKFIIKFLFKSVYRNKIERFIKSNIGPYNVSYSFADQIKWWESMTLLDFNNTVFFSFENKQFRCIGNWKEYLIHRYGTNYMIPPSNEDRCVHQLTICKWRHKNNYHQQV